MRKNEKGSTYGETGQIALTIALMIAVISAVSMSIVGRSITEVNLTRIDENASAALKAAEAGIEQSLAGLGTAPGSFTDEAGRTVANYQIEESREGTNGFLSADSVDDGGVIEVDLTGSVGLTTGGINIYWGDENDATETNTAAVEITKYQRVAADDYRRQTYTYDPNATRNDENKFSDPTVGPGLFMGVDFGASVNLPIVAEDRLVRVKVLYNKARFGFEPVAGGATLADQYYRISAQGNVGGSVFRRVEVASSSAGLNEIFDATLFSGAGLVQ